MLAGFGKFVLSLALCIQGSLLITGLDAQKNFNDNLNSTITLLPALEPLRQYSDHFDCLRYAIAALYGVSLFIVVCNCCLTSFLVSLGIILNSVISFFPVLAKDQNDIHAQIGVLKNVAVLGGLIYLVGSSCAGKQVKAAKEKQE